MDQADSILAVRFFSKPIVNDYRSEIEGRPVSEMRDFVRIEIPGNALSIIETFVNDDHKKRFPMQWAQYQNDNTMSDVQGTLLSNWSILTPAQAQDLKHYKFYTVEQVANASDQQIMSVGMIVGMSPMSFRDKAKAYLDAAKDSSVVMAQAEELRKRDQQIADLQAQMQALMARVEPEKRGPGRPRKEVAEA